MDPPPLRYGATGCRFTQISVWASTTPLTLICVHLRLGFRLRVYSRLFTLSLCPSCVCGEILLRVPCGEYLAYEPGSDLKNG
jgi:hypothetical protein